MTNFIAVRLTELELQILDEIVLFRHHPSRSACIRQILTHYANAQGLKPKEKKRLREATASRSNHWMQRQLYRRVAEAP